MKLVFATGNKGKLAEARSILGEGFEIISPDTLGITEDIPETGSTLKENSLLKAEYIWKKTGLNCFADDTGLEVDALNGEPGIYSARYAGQGHDFDANVNKLLRNLSGIPAPRKARFRCVVTLILNGEIHCFEGTMPGSIAMEKAGKGGFGYDPVFIADEYPDRTVAELPDGLKNKISHRGNSLRVMAEWIRENFGTPGEQDTYR